MSRVHHLKIKPQYFARVSDGTKRFEIRLNDRLFMKDDTLFLYEVDGGVRTGWCAVARVGYITDFGLAEGYVCMQLEGTLCFHQSVCPKCGDVLENRGGVLGCIQHGLVDG